MMDDIAESQDLSKEISEAISNPVAFGADVDEVYFKIALQNIFWMYVSVTMCNTFFFYITCLINQLNNYIDFTSIQSQIMYVTIESPFYFLWWAESENFFVFCTTIC